MKQMDGIKHLFNNLNDGLVKPTLKLGHGWVITKIWIWLRIHKLVLFNLY